jgi:hypothetical protein
MKLGELRGAIRKLKGHVYFTTDLGLRFVLQKTPLLEDLERHFPGGKAVETGISFDADTGCLTLPVVGKNSLSTGEGIGSTTSAGSTTQPPADDDLLDLGEGGSPSAEDDLLV